MIVEAAPDPSIVTETARTMPCSRYLPGAMSITSSAAACATAWPIVAHGDHTTAHEFEVSEPPAATYSTWVLPAAAADAGTSGPARAKARAVTASTVIFVTEPS